MRSLVRTMALNPNTQVAVGIMWSFSAVLVKDLTANGLDIFLISALRSLIGILFLLPLILVSWEEGTETTQLQSSSLKTDKRVVWIKLLGSSAVATNTFLLCWAFQHTAALTPIFMHFSGLLLVAPASIRVLNYTPSRREWLACGFTGVGVLALVAHGLSFDNATIVLVSLGVGLSQLVGQLCIKWLSENDKKVEKETRVKQSHGGQCFMISEVLTVFVGISISATTTTSFSSLNERAYAELLLLGTITWGLPNFLALLVLRWKPLVTVYLLWIGDVIGVAVWPVLAGQDPIPAPLSWLGAALIFTALVIQRTGQAQPKKAG